MQVFPKQIPRHGDLGKLERDIATVANDLGADLDQLFPARCYGLVFDLLRQRQCLLRVNSRRWRKRRVMSGSERKADLNSVATEIQFANVCLYEPIDVKAV